MRALLPVAVLLLLVLQAPPAVGQVPAGSPNRFDLEPRAGVFIDAYDPGETGSRAGVMGAVRAGYALGSRAGVRGTVAYGHSSDVSVPADLSNYHVYGNRYVALSGGMEYGLIPGATSIAVGLELGALWRGVRNEGTVGEVSGPPEYGGDGYTPFFLAVPSLALRRNLTSRTGLVVEVADYFFDMQEHGPALTFGLMLR